MRGTWGVAILLLGVTGLACAGKQKRVLRDPTVQQYDLPPLDAKAFSEPPTYPEEKAAVLNPNSSSGSAGNPGGMGGGKSGMGGPGMGGGGMGGASPGGPGMGSGGFR